MDPLDDPDREYVHTTKGCFGCGTENPAGLRLRPYHDGEWIVAQYTPQPHHRGFTRVVHGGLIAALLDEVITSAAAVRTEVLMATLSIEVQFRSPMKLEASYTVRGRYTGEVGKIHTAEGEIRDSAGREIAMGRGKFLPLTPDRLEKFL